MPITMQFACDLIGAKYRDYVCLNLSCDVPRAIGTRKVAHAEPALVEQAAGEVGTRSGLATDNNFPVAG